MFMRVGIVIFICNKKLQKRVFKNSNSKKKTKNFTVNFGVAVERSYFNLV